MKLGVETIWQDRKRVLGMPLTFTKYFLSEDRLFLQTGVLNMKMEEVLLYRVSDIGVHVSLGQRIFGVGTIITTCVNGLLIGLAEKLLDRFFLFRPAFPALAKRFEMD